MRMLGGLVLTGRQTTEQTFMGVSYSLATLGFFSRSIGLSTLLAGRIGSLFTQALYPVITRAERNSPRFRNIASLVVQSIAWVSIPSAVFLAFNADDIVAVLYGLKWAAVAPLIPLAAAYVLIGGLTATFYNLLLANDETRYCLIMDILTAGSAIVIILLAVPRGVEFYLQCVVAHALMMSLCNFVMLVRTGGIDKKAIFPSIVPPASGSAFAIGILYLAAPAIGFELSKLFNLCLYAAIFSVSYLIFLRLFFSRSTERLVEALPKSPLLKRMLLLH